MDVSRQVISISKIRRRSMHSLARPNSWLLSRKMRDQRSTLPKFGGWDVNDLASVVFTVIFNKARDERKRGDSTPGPEFLEKDDVRMEFCPSNSKKWFCCMQPSPARS